MAEVVVKAANSICTGQMGFLATLRVRCFSGVGFFPTPTCACGTVQASRIHARLVVELVKTHLPVTQPLDIAFLEFYKFLDT